ncbi:MAG: RidA family protein [Alphaproteobacteria bacterium]
MAGRIAARLSELAITLPEAPPPAANYVPWVRSGNQVIVAGQIPVRDGKRPYVGKLGGGVSNADGQAAARLCAINLLAQVRAAVDGDLDRVVRVLRLGGFVNATADFTEHPAIINAASDLMVEVFGEAGRHARFAVGAPSLPFDVAVEIDGLFEVR